MSGHLEPAPYERKLLTPGVMALIALAAIGGIFGLYRFVVGLQDSTNLTQEYPWGLWIIADISFIALGAGGFTTAAIAHVFHREQFHALARPALVVALLGYTFASCALLADLGKYYNIWHPILPQCWQGNSALFEVGMCVMCYLTVLWVEFIPAVCERFVDDLRFPLIARLCGVLNKWASKAMFLFVIAGVGISCLHQSSLGHIMVLVPSKLHGLWYSPILSIMFLTSAIAVGFPTVLFACLYASWAFKFKPDMKTLGSLARFVPILLAVYIAFKAGDMLIRGSYVYLNEISLQTASFAVEIVAGLFIPFAMFLSPRVRQSPRRLALASGLVMMGVVLNRVNVYWIGYHPARADYRYFPSITEWAVTIGSLAMLLLVWRILATYLPILTVQPKAKLA